jgi:hypothetical protein
MPCSPIAKLNFVYIQFKIPSFFHKKLFFTFYLDWVSRKNTKYSLGDFKQ